MTVPQLYRSLTKRLQTHQKGFTLIELLVVIGILAVLLAIVLIAINPAKQFSQANDTKRSSDVNAILNAVHQYAADNKGVLPGANAYSDDPEAASPISFAVVGEEFCTALVTEYLAALPRDPFIQNGDPIDVDECGDFDTGYTVYQSADNNRVTVSAPRTENGPKIEVTR